MASETRAYSVLSHEANDRRAVGLGHPPAAWPDDFPKATRDELLKARAYAYGGSVIQDLGYYPFGSRFFSNLLHYVRTGDFVEAMIRDAKDLDEFAFALGALAHYVSDNVGHPEGVNRAVALMFPKLRAQYGPSVTYADSPASHVIVEFSFDVVQAATGRYRTEAYQSFIGFEVAKPLLERAFAEIYGLEMKDVFVDEDLAIGSYRHAISQTDPGDHAHRLARQARGDREGAARRRQRDVRLQPDEAGVRERRTARRINARACWRASWRFSTSCCRRSGR